MSNNPLTRTTAGKLELLRYLLDPTWVDEDGVEHHGEPIISKEQALALLQADGDTEV